MEINRKRVARRLASGLVAGALALGGLAISGGTASAVTPDSKTVNRFAGDDRYETAVKLARDLNAVGGGLVIVSGESPWDALSAAPLTSSTRPMLLVRQNSIPESVSDFISDYKSGLVSGQPKIYVVGGTSAVSDEVATAIGDAAATAGDTTPPKIVRIAGDDRYETSQKVAALSAVTSSSDKVVLVSGTNAADAVAVGFIASKQGWPIVLLPGSVSGSGEDAIDAYLAMPGSVAEFLIVGGPAVMSSTIEESLVSKDVVPADIRRVGGADRYNTSLLLNVYALSEGIFNGDKIALVSGETPWDALAAAGWAAVNGVHVQTTPTAGGNVSALTLSGAIAGLNTEGQTTARIATGNSSMVTPWSHLYIIGGKNAVSESAKAQFLGAASTDLTSSISGCAQGGTSFILSTSAKLTTAENGAMTTAATIDDQLELNGVSLNGDVSSSTKLADGVYFIVLAGTAFTAPATALDEDDVLEFLTQVEGTSNISISRSIVGSECTVEADTTDPVVSIRAINGTSGGSATANMAFLVTSNEPIAAPAVAAGKVTIAHSAGDETNTVALDAAAVGSDGKTYILTTAAAGEATLTTALATAIAGTSITFDASSFSDLAGNNPSDDIIIAVGADDSKAPVLSVSSVKCTAVSGVLDATKLAKMTAGNLVVTAKSTSTLGAAGNAYTLSVVNQRGILLPQVQIDADAKTITVTADTGYHKVADVKTAFQNQFADNLLLGDWTVSGTGDLSATVVPAVSIAGTSSCVVTVTSNEPFSMFTGGATVAINGYAQSAVVVENAAAYADLVTGMRNSRTLTFTTTQLGTGVFAFSSDANAPQDIKGNDVLAGLSFTAS